MNNNLCDCLINQRIRIFEDVISSFLEELVRIISDLISSLHQTFIEIIEFDKGQITLTDLLTVLIISSVFYLIAYHILFFVINQFYRNEETYGLVPNYFHGSIAFIAFVLSFGVCLFIWIEYF